MTQEAKTLEENYLDRFSEVVDGLKIKPLIANKLANFIHYEVQTAKKKAFNLALSSALSVADVKKLSDLRDICIEDDLLDLPAYNSIERAEKISSAWEALKVIDNIKRLRGDLK